MELPYKEVSTINPTDARKRIVQTYHQTGNYCKTARRWHTSPQLVRKGVQRYQQYGDQGLHDQPRTPKRQPKKTDPDIEACCSSTRRPAMDASGLPATSPNKASSSLPPPFVTSSDATPLPPPVPASHAVVSIPLTGRGRAKNLSPSSKPM